MCQGRVREGCVRGLEEGVRGCVREGLEEGVSGRG